MRPRPPSQIITYLEISESPPPYTNPTADSYATSGHILCQNEHQKLFRSIRSLAHITLPWFHLHILLSTKIQLPYFLSPETAPPPPRRDFTSAEAKLKYNTSTLRPHLVSLHLRAISHLLSVYMPVAPAQINIIFHLKTRPAGELSLKAFSLISMAQSAPSLSKSMALTTLPSYKHL